MSAEGQVYRLYLKRELLDSDHILSKYSRAPSNEELASAVREITADEPVETVLALFLAGGDVLVGYCELSKGGFEWVNWDPKALFAYGILCGATGIVMAHNHPSGKAKASPRDVRGMKDLIPAASLVGLRVLDHIVVAPEEYCSMREFGLLPPQVDLIKELRKAREKIYEEIQIAADLQSR